MVFFLFSNTVTFYTKNPILYFIKHLKINYIHLSRNITVIWKPNTNYVITLLVWRLNNHVIKFT